MLGTGSTPLATPETDGRGKTFGLEELRGVNLARKGRIESRAQVRGHVNGKAPGVIGGLIVEVEGGGLGVTIEVHGAKREESVDGTNRWKSLHAKLGDEAPTELVILLVGLLGTMPD